MKLEISKRMMFESLLAEGVEMPEPKNEDETDYSGKFIVRMPKSLHRSLAERAEAEGVSLNQFVVSLLSLSAAVYGFEAATKACIKALEDGICVHSKPFRRANRKLEKV